MHPVLFEIDVPQFLQGVLPSSLTIYSYGTLIALGALAGYFFTIYQAKKELNINSDSVTDLMIFVIIAAVVGGRFFLYFENPEYYFGTPSNMLNFSSRGFVFYGSLIFAIPTMLIVLKKKKMPVLPMLDIMAFTAVIVHAFGRMGCFLAGCCYGVHNDNFPHVTFTHEFSAAKPLNEPLHPTQLYSVIMLLTIFVILYRIKRNRKFYGQVFLSYMALYAVGRGIIEIFRGDLARGFVISNVLSNSQFISLIFLGVVIYFYNKLSKKPGARVPK
jgi:phosphatidylglycerol:prolipoprotein diacylglycerol transferase